MTRQVRRAAPRLAASVAEPAPAAEDLSAAAAIASLDEALNARGDLDDVETAVLDQVMSALGALVEAREGTRSRLDVELTMARVQVLRRLRDALVRAPRGDSPAGLEALLFGGAS